MNLDLFHELRKIRNGFAHGASNVGHAELANRLSNLGLSISAADLSQLIPTILKAFGGGSPSHQVPHFLLQVIVKVLEGQHAEVVCDPWAGLGEVLATVKETTH